jgi:hypothetical protein
MTYDEITAFLETNFEDHTIINPMDAVMEITTDHEAFCAVIDWLMVNGHDKLAEIYANHSFPEYYEQYTQQYDLEEEE